MNFFPAYDLKAVMEMEAGTFDLLYKAMSSVKAQQNIQECLNLDYSNSKKEPRDRYRRKMYELAFPWQNEETMSAETIARMFGSGGRQTTDSNRSPA